MNVLNNNPIFVLFIKFFNISNRIDEKEHLLLSAVIILCISEWIFAYPRGSPYGAAYFSIVF